MVALEVPEMFLHPHAQRGLMRMFRELSDSGTQIFYSTHSSAFVDVERFDEVFVVERCPDLIDDELCTLIWTLSEPELLALHKKNRPGEDIRIDGIRERYRHACGAEHTGWGAAERRRHHHRRRSRRRAWGPCTSRGSGGGGAGTTNGSLRRHGAGQRIRFPSPVSRSAGDGAPGSHGRPYRIPRRGNDVPLNRWNLQWDRAASSRIASKA